MKTYNHVVEYGFNVIKWREGSTVGFYKEGQDLYAEAMATGSVVMQTEEELDAIANETNRLIAKQVRDSALNSMTYTFEDGRVIQTRPQDGLNIQTAIGLGEDIEFVCSDNSIATFTVLELQEAMTAGVLQAKAVWSTYIDSIR